MIGQRAAAPMVTVVMTHYRCEPFLAEAAGSILAQSFRDLELWVIDDASPSREWRDALAPFRGDPRLRLFASDANVGTYRLKTAALGAVRGPLVAFQDSDDASEPERLAVQVAALDRRRLDIVGSGYSIVTEDGGVAGRRRMPRWCNWLERLGKTHFIHHPTCLVRARVFDAIGGFDGAARIGADTDFILRAAQRFRIGNVGAPLYRYRERSDSLTHAPGTGYGSPLRESYAEATRARWKQIRGAGAAADLRPAPIDVDFTVAELQD